MVTAYIGIWIWAIFSYYRLNTKQSNLLLKLLLTGTNLNHHNILTGHHNVMIEHQNLPQQDTAWLQNCSLTYHATLPSQSPISVGMLSQRDIINWKALICHHTVTGKERKLIWAWRNRQHILQFNLDCTGGSILFVTWIKKFPWYSQFLFLFNFNLKNYAIHLKCSGRQSNKTVEHIYVFNYIYQC